MTGRRSALQLVHPGLQDLHAVQDVALEGVLRFGLLHQPGHVMGAGGDLVQPGVDALHRLAQASNLLLQGGLHALNFPF